MFIARKKLFVVITTILLSIMIFSCNQDNTNQKNDNANEGVIYTMKDFSIKDNINYFHISGRCPLTDTGLACDWGASGFSFNVNCEGDVSLHYTKDSEAEIFFTVYVDGVRQENRLKLTGISGTCIIVENLVRGSHTIELYKQTQNQKGFLCEFDKVTFKGTFEAAPPAKNFTIEFLGDSITAGIGNLGRNGIDGGEPVNSDATQTYAFITSRALNVDFSVIAQGGASLTPGTGTGIHLASIYKYVNFERGTECWDTEKSINIIVVNLGTNDRGVNSNDFIDGIIAIANGLREKHKDSKIVFCMGMMAKGERSIEFKRAVKQLGEDSKGFYFLLLPANNDGSGAHPSVIGNQNAADVLIPFLNNLL